MADQIRIRVGAAVDRNIGNAFRPVVDAARAARQAVEDEMGRAWAAVRGEGSAVGGGAGKGGPYRSVVRQAERAANDIVAAERRKQRQIESEEKRALRQREAALRHVARIRDRHFTEQQRQGERSEKLAAKDAERTRRDNVGRLKGVAGGSVETLGKIGRGALGVAGSVARGAGVQTDLGSYIGQAVELEKRASELSASAYKPGEARRNVRTEGGRQGLVELARSVGNQEAYDPTKVIEGLQAFVGKTGALDVGEAAVGGLAKLARATGTDLQDMVSAAGDASNALGEVGEGKEFATAEDKARALVATMRTIAGQGKVGAVEIADLAREMAKVGAASMAFGGDKQKNIEFMGALAQMARASGGAAGPAEAATAVQGFVNTLKTPARIKAFVGAGVKQEDIYDEAGALRDPKSIITNALKAAGDDPIAFKKLFANVVGARTVEPAATTYRDARAKALKGGASETDAAQKGVDAVLEMFTKFNTAIGADEEQESRNRNMRTSAARVQLFNNKLSEIGEKIADKVLPQLERLAPSIIKVADAFARMVAFAVENPGTAITAAIVASIGKAAVGSAISGALGKLLDSAGGKFSGKMNMALASAAITIAAATIIAQYLNEKKEAGMAGSREQRESVKADVDAVAAKKDVSQEDLARLKADRSVIQNQIQEGQRYFETGRERYGGEGVLDTIGGGFNQIYDVARGKTTFEDIGRGKEAEAKFPELLEQRAAIDRLIATIEKNSGKPIKAEITNLPNAPGPVANVGATTP